MFLHERYTEELKKIHGADVDPKSVPFNVVAVYAMSGGTPAWEVCAAFHSLWLSIFNS
jgi:hypothetical protein